MNDVGDEDCADEVVDPVDGDGGEGGDQDGHESLGRRQLRIIVSLGVRESFAPEKRQAERSHDGRQQGRV